MWPLLSFNNSIWAIRCNCSSVTTPSNHHQLLDQSSGSHWRWTWLKARTERKTDSQMNRLNFIEKLYFTIAGLFCRCKGDNMHIASINHLQQCPWSLVRKTFLNYYILHLKISQFVWTSHLVWCRRPSIIAKTIHGKSKARSKTGYDIVPAKLQVINVGW